MHGDLQMVKVVVMGDQDRLISCRLLGFCWRLTRTQCLHSHGRRKKTVKWNAAKKNMNHWILSHMDMHSKEKYTSRTCHSLIMGDSCAGVPTHAQTCRHCRQKSTVLMTDDAHQGKMSGLSCTKPEPWNRTLRHPCDVRCCQSVLLKWCFHWCRCLKLCSCRVVSMLSLPRRSFEVGHRWFHPNIPCPWVWHIFTYAHLHKHTHTRSFAVLMIPNTHSIGGVGPLLRMFSDAVFSFYSIML